MSDNKIAYNYDDEIDIFNILSVLIRNFKTIFIISLSFMIGIVVISIISKMLPTEKSFLPDTYSPSSLVMLNSNSSGGMDSLMGGSGMGAIAGLAGLSGGELGPSEADIAKKLATTNNFIKQLDNYFDLGTVYSTINMKYPNTELKQIITSNLAIELDEDSGLLEISYTDTDKVLATEITNKATAILEEEFKRIDIIKNRDQFQLVEDKKIKVEAEIEKIARDTIKFQKKHNLINVDIVFTELMKQVSSLQSSLLSKDVEIENYKMVSSIKDPGYKRLVNERRAIINAISKLENGEAGNFPPVKDLPELALELQELKADMAVKETVYKTIIQQYEALKLTAQGTGPTFQVLEKAEIPEVKSGPSRGKLCIIVTFIGFFVSIFFVFARETWRKIKNDPEKLRRLKGDL